MPPWTKGTSLLPRAVQTSVQMTPWAWASSLDRDGARAANTITHSTSHASLGWSESRRPMCQPGCLGQFVIARRAAACAAWFMPANICVMNCRASLGALAGDPAWKRGAGSYSK